MRVSAPASPGQAVGRNPVQRGQGRFESLNVGMFPLVLAALSGDDSAPYDKIPSKELLAEGGTSQTEP